MPQAPRAPILQPTAAANESSTRRTRRKDARPGELLAAALDLFVEKGFAQTRVEEVAARAGVSKGTLFLYYSSKEELFKAVVRENLSGRFAEWNDEFETFGGSAADMLRYAVGSWWERIGATQACGITKLMISEARNFPELAAFYRAEVAQPAHELIARILQRGIDRREFRAMDVQHTVYSVVAPLVFLALSHHSTGVCVAGPGEIVPERYLAAQVETLLYGVCRDPTEAAASCGPGVGTDSTGKLGAAS